MLQQRSWLYAVLVLAGGLIGGAVSAQFAPSVAMAPRRWGGLFTDSSRESLDRGTRWRMTQSGANHSPLQFRANRENNREISSFFGLIPWTMRIKRLQCFSF